MIRLYVVGFGPGNREGMTINAEQILRETEIIVGYDTYAAILKTTFPDKEYITTGMRSEMKRVKLALSHAAEGRKVAVVCSGDGSVYGMASLLFEMAEREEYLDRVEIIPVPGVTAALSGGALLGAPLSDDYLTVSLSDHLTPKEVILQRLTAAAASDLCTVIYNPKCKARPLALREACELFLQYRMPETVCGFCDRIGREEEKSLVLSLSELCEISKTDRIGMQSIVFIGNSKTRNIGGKMVTLRGYTDKYV